MKKAKLFAASLAAMALVGCTDEEYVGAVDNPTGDGIGFGSGVTATTRGTTTGLQAAEKLNNNFIVYGFKTSATEAADGSKDIKVFDRYNVNYEAGTANTTESNTANWEYVGYANHDGSINPQTIKYWDYSATSYVFSAVSGTGITATKTLTGTTVYDKGWTVTIPAGGDISTLYASDRKPVTSTDYKKQVDLTFRALGTKIRFAMYEVIPGYDVHIDKFYYGSTGAWNNTETNFAINGTFMTVNPSAATDLKVTYYDVASGIENRPKVSYSEGTGDGAAVSVSNKTFGANIQATPAIGTTSAEATYDQSDKSYTMILPYEGASNNLELYVDYTLKSTDGSGETIKVWHASAKVPSNFAQWKPNFAYTYIFKISDNTNGSTVTPSTPGDENDPESSIDPDKIGLFPITFDAVVVTDETDVQETITSVSDPSITTYQEGEVVTKNDEYVAGDIFFESISGTTTTSNVSGYHVYEVNNYGTEATTEEIVANWKNNFCVLTEVTTTDASTLSPAGIPLSNGTYLKKNPNEAAKFTAVAGKTYVIVSGEAKDLDPTASKAQCKVVKVSGNLAVAPTYTQAMTTGSITAANEVAVYKLKSNSPKANSVVIGAAPLLKVYDSSDNDVTTNFTIAPGSADGNYKIGLTPAAIAAGANGTYTVKFNGDGDKTFSVSLSMTLLPTVIYVVTAGTGSTFKLTDGTNAISNAEIKNLPAGLTIEETSTAGTYMVTASKDAATGVHHVLVAGQDLAISVLSYSFSAPVLTITRKLSGNNTGTITLNENGVAKTGISLTTSPALATGTTVAESAGVYTYTVTDASEGGVYDISYENAKAQVVVNAYTITADVTSITAPTGSAKLTVTKNGKPINATVGKVLVTATINGVDCWPTVGSQYSLTTNGSTLLFRPSVAGSYNFTYVEDGEQVAVATVTVTE